MLTQDIALFDENWDDLFKEHYNFYGKGKKSELVRWIRKLNQARTITHHPEKWPLSKDEVSFVRRVYDLVKTHIEDNEPVEANHRYLDDSVSA